VPADFSVQAAHAVDRPAAPDCQIGHVETFRRVVRRDSGSLCPVVALCAEAQSPSHFRRDYGRSRGLEAEYIKRIGDWFRGTVSGSYSISTGKSSTPDESIFRLQQGQPENIKESYLIWDRPLQVSLNLNFTVPKDQPLFGVDVLKEMNLFVRVFYESGKRYTPQIFTGIDAASGRPQYVGDLNNVNGSIGQYWFWIDLNFEKYFDLGFGRLVANVEVQNLLDRKNSQIINPATGRAYEYGDPTPNSYNDPLYPQLTGTISPFPYDPSRYLNPRTVRFSLAVRF